MRKSDKELIATLRLHADSASSGHVALSVLLAAAANRIERLSWDLEATEESLVLVNDYGIRAW